MKRPGSWEWYPEALEQLAVAPDEAPSRQAGRVETYGEGIEKLNEMPIVENGEPLVDLRSVQPPPAFAQAHPWGAFYRRQFWVRHTVAEMLARAQTRLPGGYRILIIEGYRPPMLQRRLFQGLYWYFHCLYPDWEEYQLREATNVLIADPDTTAPPPHSTGGAVDVTLADAAGRPVDMTSPVGWNEASAPTCCQCLDPEACARRRILIEALSSTGLTNYPGEWWHWSYGDSGWAIRTGQPNAVYGPLTSPYAPVPGGAT